MGHGLSAQNPFLAAAFHEALRVEALAALVVVAMALLLWQPVARIGRRRLGVAAGPAADTEPAARRLLRLGFGILWVLDGLLQTQRGMVLGLPTEVVQPAEAGSPRWVHHLVHVGLAVWTRHPIAAASSVVWIQLAIGLLLLFAPGWSLSRAAGALSVPWALAVWVFGEALGGVLAPGGSWLFGLPGAALLYAVAGGLVALPPGAWTGRRLGRAMLGVGGLAMLGMAVLQAWPGRGFWRGGAGGQLPSMVSSMSTTPQPGALASALSGFGRFGGGHAAVVNLVVVLALAFTGLAMLSGRRRLVAAGVATGLTLALATWILVQDLGFMGGVGTDPNSMLPWGLLLGGAFLAWQGAPAVAPAGAYPAVPAAIGSGAAGALGRLVALPVAAVTATLAAAGLLVIGLVPAASAAIRPGTTVLLVEAANGAPQRAPGAPAPGFELVDQRGRTVSLASLRGRVVTLTFLDPVCSTDCPLIAGELKQADAAIGDPSRTAFVAVVANPTFRAAAVVRAFDREQGLEGVRNWYYLTGSRAQLAAVWRAYGIDVESLPAGGMVAHTEQAFVIDSRGRLRWTFTSDPGSAPASLGAEVEQTVRDVLR